MSTSTFAAEQAQSTLDARTTKRKPLRPSRMRTLRARRQHKADVLRCVRWWIRTGRVHVDLLDVPRLTEPAKQDAQYDAYMRLFDREQMVSFGRVSHRSTRAKWIRCERCNGRGQDPDARNLTHDPMTGTATGHDGTCQMCWGDGGWAPGKCPRGGRGEGGR